MVSAMEEPTIVTCLVGVLDLTSGEVELASAGHLPPLILDDRGPCRALDLAPGPPLGVLGAVFESSRTRIAPGQGMVAFTDGLVESREQSFDDGIDLLREVLDDVLGDGAGQQLAADDLCTSAVVGMSRTGTTSDDVAVLVMRRAPTAGGPEGAGRRLTSR